jgi:hypothetical protein
MKRIALFAVVASLLSAPAYAWGPREQGMLAGAAGLWIYQQLSRPPVAVYQQPAPVIVAPPPVVYQQPAPVYQQAPSQIYVYPTNVPIPPGMSCNLYSEMINGQVVTANYCQYR